MNRNPVAAVSAGEGARLARLLARQGRHAQGLLFLLALTTATSICLVDTLVDHQRRAVLHCPPGTRPAGGPPPEFRAAACVDALGARHGPYVEWEMTAHGDEQARARLEAEYRHGVRVRAQWAREP